MTATELKQRLLRVIGIDSPGAAPAHVVDEVVHAINHAYQVMWQDVPRVLRSAYTRRIDSVTLDNGQRDKELAEDVQAVLPPVQLLPTYSPLIPASHRSEINSFGFLRGRLEPDPVPGSPQIYWIESKFQAAADSMRVTLIVAPTPTKETELRVEVEIAAPTVSSADLCGSTPTPLKVPNDYAESILYPLAAYHLAAASQRFKNPERFPAIEAEYERAKSRLGITDPSTIAAARSVKPSDR